jgi:hypothetical protein
MFQAGGMILSLWWREKLDIDGGVAARGGYGHAALPYARPDADFVRRSLAPRAHRHLPALVESGMSR